VDTTEISPFRVCPQCGVVYRNGFQRCPIDGEVLVALTRDLMLGKTIDRYEIEAFIGDGMTGRVYRARHEELSRRYAIKVLYGDFSANPDMSARFLREAEAASRLEHPHVVHVLDARLDPNGPTYLVMDLVEGPTLSDWLKREGPWGEIETIELLRKLASGLAHAHAHGIIHRDLKPENILFGPEPRISDFGVAWIAPSPDAPQLTRAGEVLGTPGFIAPEVVMGHPATQRADLYALGMVGFQTLIGRHPYSGSEMEVMTRTLQRSVPFLREYGVDAPRLEPLLHRLVSADPGQRPASAADVEGELQSLLLDEDAPPPRRRAIMVSALAAAVVALLVLGFAFTSPSNPEPPAVGPLPEELEVSAPSTTVDEAPKLPPPPVTKPEPKTKPPSAPAPNDDPKAPPTEAPATPPPRRRPSRPKPAPTAATEPPPPVQASPSTQAFQSLYGRVAKTLDRLKPEDSEAMRERFMSISITRAMQDEAARTEAMDELRGIAKEAQSLDGSDG